MRRNAAPDAEADGGQEVTSVSSGTDQCGFFDLLSAGLTCGCRLQPDESSWFDVGVFRGLYSEVTHYFLPADKEPAASAKEVKVIFDP